MTSIEWLIDQLVKMDKQLDGRRKNEDATILKMNPTKLFEQAKEMHKQEMEISDEQIREQAIKYDNGAFSETPIVHFMKGAFWYREQLKSKGNGDNN